MYPLPLLLQFTYILLVGKHIPSHIHVLSLSLHPFAHVYRMVWYGSEEDTTRGQSTRKASGQPYSFRNRESTKLVKMNIESMSGRQYSRSNEEVKSYHIKEEPQYRGNAFFARVPLPSFPRRTSSGQVCSLLWFIMSYHDERDTVTLDSRFSLLLFLLFCASINPTHPNPTQPNSPPPHPHPSGA